MAAAENLSREPAATTCHHLFSKASAHASPGHQEAAGLQGQRGEKEGRCGSSHLCLRAQQGAPPAALMSTGFDERLVLICLMSGYLHSCVRSCLRSADSCSNTVKDEVICIITSVNARKYAYRSMADSNNSNTPWSGTLLRLPFRYGSVSKRQHNVLRSFQHFQNKTLVFLLLVCQTRIHQPIFRPAVHFYIDMELISSHAFEAASIVGGTVLLMVMSIGTNPATKGQKFDLFILLGQTSCLKCEHKRGNMRWRSAFAWRNDKLQCVLEAEGSVFIHRDGSGGGLTSVKGQSWITMVHFNVCLH